MKRLLAIGALAFGLSACAGPGYVGVETRSTYPAYVSDDPSVVVVDQGPYAYRYRYHRVHRHRHYIGH